MQIYHFNAKSQAGESQKGKVEARDEHHAVQVLRERGLVVINLKLANNGGLLESLSIGSGIKSKDLVVFTQQMATMINSGLALTDALSLLQAQSKPALATVIGEVLRDVEGGASLGDGMARQKSAFSDVYVALVKAGEASGKLDEVMDRLAETEEKRHAFRSKVRGAMIYPVIVMAAMLIVGVVMMTVVVPQLTAMYDDLGAELPMVTQLLIGVSDLMVKFWWLFAILFAAAGWFLARWGRTLSGRKQLDIWLLKMPVFGPLTTEVILTDFNRTLALLTRAGISILESLEIVSKSTGNAVFQEAIAKASKSVEKGAPLAAALAQQQVFPPLMAQMVSVGEETGKMDEVLLKVSQYFESEAENKVKNLTTAMEPIIMIIMGIGVAFLVFAVIMPIYNLTAQF